MARSENSNELNELNVLKAKFDDWRRTRTKRSLSTELWDEAARLACVLGVSRVSGTLKLDYSRLKVRAEEEKPRSRAVSKETKINALDGSRFVELPPLATLQQSQAKKGIRVDIFCGIGKQVQINWESPEAEDWESFFSGLLRAEGTKPVEVVS